MVKSVAGAMSTKSRLSKVDRELMKKELEDLDRRARETDRRIAVTLDKARQTREMLRAIMARG